MQGTTALHPVIREAAKRQQGRGIVAAAADLGISKSAWHLLATGRRQPSLAMLRRICARYPDLAAEVFDELRGKGAA